ncbi:hypothetical protein Tco_0992518, partial [Tanacetum coccineum]
GGDVEAAGSRLQHPVGMCHRCPHSAPSAPASKHAQLRRCEKIKKKNKYVTKQVNLMMKLFRSDEKFLQMLNQYESTPEFDSGSGGCEDDEMADDDEEDEEDGNS